MRFRQGVIIALIIVVIASSIASSCAVRRGEKIALINLSGTIAGVEQVGLLTTAGITPEMVRGYLKRAEADPSVKAVVLRVDSHGGTAAASQEIAQIIRRFDKPVVVSMGDVAASGGYYICVYADRIVAQPSTITGSIGVMVTVINIRGLLEKLGIEAETITSGEYKSLAPPLSDEERKILQDICDEIHEEFVRAVAEGRNLSHGDVRRLATGQPYTGKQALERGLVDKLGNLEDAIALAAEIAGVEKPLVERYGPPPWWQRLLGLLLKLENLLKPELSDDQTLFLKTLEGWHAVPRCG